MSKEYNLSEIVTAVAEKSTLNKKVVKEVAQEIILAIAENLPIADKMRVEIDGFGVLFLKQVAERSGKTSGKIGPVTEWTKPAHLTVKFRAHPDLIMKINEDDACLKNITYVNEKNQTRKISKLVISNMIKYLKS